MKICKDCGKDETTVKFHNGFVCNRCRRKRALLKPKVFKICKICGSKEIDGVKFPLTAWQCNKCIAKKNRAYMRQYTRDRYKSDPAYHEKELLRSREKSRRPETRQKQYLRTKTSPRRWLLFKMCSVRGTASRHKPEKYEYDLTLDFLCGLWKKQNGLCAISNLQMTHRPFDLYAASIDRVDSSRGYTTDNVQLVCKAINLAKNAATNEEIKEFIIKVSCANRA